MIELKDDQLTFRFPSIEEELRTRIKAWGKSRLAEATEKQRRNYKGNYNCSIARLAETECRTDMTLDFQRTLRIPDDGKEYPLPPGLGRFPVRHVDDFEGVPESWKKTGGVMLPMHRVEGMWIAFRNSNYPMALRIAGGGICAASGQRWATGLSDDPQNYLVPPYQLWLDGFRINEHSIRQFVAVPLGKGLTVEQQLTGDETWGGLQIQAFPCRIDRYWPDKLQVLKASWTEMVRPPQFQISGMMARLPRNRVPSGMGMGMGMGAGGTMQQEIYQDTRGLDAWDTDQTSRCYVRLCLAEDWKTQTGERCPHEPPTASEYSAARLPWFDYTDGDASIEGETPLTDVKSVNTLVTEKTGIPIPDNESVGNLKVKNIGPENRKSVKEF